LLPVKVIGLKAVGLEPEPGIALLRPDGSGGTLEDIPAGGLGGV